MNFKILGFWKFWTFTHEVVIRSADLSFCRSLAWSSNETVKKILEPWLQFIFEISLHSNQPINQPHLLFCAFFRIHVYVAAHDNRYERQWPDHADEQVGFWLAICKCLGWKLSWPGWGSQLSLNWFLVYAWKNCL